MANNFTILAGSVSQGIWRSPDGGQSWRNFHGKPPFVWEPFNLEAEVRGLAVDPHDPAVLYAGDEKGICKSTDRGATWTRLHGPMDGFTVWSLAVDPADSSIVFAGARPPALFRSEDAGKTWERLNAVLPQECDIGVPRVLAMRIDPLDHRNIWAGVEVAGVYKSHDGGDTWTRVRGGLKDDHDHEDIHDVTLIPGMQFKGDTGKGHLEQGKGETVLVTTPRGILATSDMGETFHTFLSGSNFKLSYVRSVAVKPDDPNTIFVGKSDTAIGSQGDLIRTKDGGRTWENCRLPVEPNSGIFGIAVHPSNPDVVVAVSLFGQIYKSEDAGDSWMKLKRECNELRAVKWVPNS